MRSTQQGVGEEEVRVEGWRVEATGGALQSTEATRFRRLKGEDKVLTGVRQEYRRDEKI